MKRLGLLTALVLALALCACCALAEEEEILEADDFMYAIREDGSAELINYVGSGDAVVIPNELDGHPVTAVRQNPFISARTLNWVTPSVAEDHPYLTVTDGVLFGKTDGKLICCPSTLPAAEYAVPDGTRIIADGAFYGCAGLTAVTLPETLTEIGSSAFAQCSALRTAAIPAGVTSIGPQAFADCRSLTSAVIPEGVTVIAHHTFEGCAGLTEAVIPATVTEIGSSAFANCTGLTGIVLPEGVARLGDSVFIRCAGLTSASLPASLTAIGSWVFAGCENLTLSVPAGSYAETWCIENGLPHTAFDPAG